MTNQDYSASNYQPPVSGARSRQNTFKLNLDPKKIIKPLLILAVAILTFVIASVLTGVFSAFGGNLSLINTTVVFDPSITIAYILVYYLISHFTNLSRNQSYGFFLTALLLSYTVDFVTGSLLLILLPLVLQKLHLIEPSVKA